MVALLAVQKERSIRWVSLYVHFDFLLISSVNEDQVVICNLLFDFTLWGAWSNSLWLNIWFYSFLNLLLNYCSFCGIKWWLGFHSKKIFNLCWHIINPTGFNWVSDHAIVGWFSYHADRLGFFSWVLLNYLIFVVVESFNQISAILWCILVMKFWWWVFCALRLSMIGTKGVFVLIRTHFYDIKLLP